MARRPQGNKLKQQGLTTKKSRLNDTFLRAQAKATTTTSTAEIMHDAGALVLFCMKSSDLHGEDAKEYVELRRKEEELRKLKERGVRARELALARLTVV
jgi:hypothetical protein